MHSYATLLRHRVVIGFHGFLLVCFLSCLYVLSLGNWLGKRKFGGAWGEFCGTQQVR